MIQIQNLSKQYGSKVLFESAETQIGYRSRVALIGPNGAGKSTLIRIILSQEFPDSGLISKSKNLRIGYLAQELPKLSGKTVLEETLRLDGRREELIAEKTELEELFSRSGSDGETEITSERLDRYGQVLEDLEGLDEYRLESRAKEILSGMGFKASDLHRSLQEFSGGWLMRVALSRILLMEPDLLLLDEPTNHLDLESLLWLENFLTSFRGAMLLVSHDSEFLNRLVHEVVEIDQRKLWIYRGNLDSYAEQKKQRLEVLLARYEAQQVRKREIQDFVTRFGVKATKARQAQSRLKELDKMEEIEIPEDRASVRFRFPPAPHSGKEVVTFKGVGLQFSDKKTSKVVFRDLEWVIQRGSRVAIVGVNGAGKTTLLRLLSQTLAPTEGEARLGHEVKVGYYAQFQAETLDMKKTVLQELEETAPLMPVSQVRGIAGAFLFSGDAVLKKCGVLSGGEKARVALAKLLLSPSNFLILDEPTNHLDMDSRQVLLEALKSYNGTLVIVSHDRSFITPLVNSVLEIVPDDSGKGSQVHHLLLSYSEFLQRKLKECAETTSLARKASAEKSVPQSKDLPASSVEQSPAVESKGPSNNQKKQWSKEQKDLEQKIEKLEARQNELHVQLASQQTYDDKPLMLQLLEEQREVEKKLGDYLSQWERVCHLLGSGPADSPNS